GGRRRQAAGRSRGGAGGPRRGGRAGPGGQKGVYWRWRNCAITTPPMPVAISASTLGSGTVTASQNSALKVQEPANDVSAVIRTTAAASAARPSALSMFFPRQIECAEIVLPAGRSNFDARFHNPTITTDCVGPLLAIVNHADSLPRGGPG